MSTSLPLKIQSGGLAKIVLLCFFLTAHAAIAEEESNPRIRHEFSDQNAPPGIRFRIMLRVLTSKSENSEVFANSALDDLGFTPEDMPRIHNYLVSLSRELDNEVDRGIWRVACHGEAESLEGLEVRVVYNSFDDIRFAVAAKYLAIASAEMAGMGYPTFLESIEKYPGAGGSFKTISTEHRLAWGDTDSEIKANRARLCSSLLEKYGYELSSSSGTATDPNLPHASDAPHVSIPTS